MSLRMKGLTCQRGWPFRFLGFSFFVVGRLGRRDSPPSRRRARRRFNAAQNHLSLMGRPLSRGHRNGSPGARITNAFEMEKGAEIKAA